MMVMMTAVPAMADSWDDWHRGDHWRGWDSCRWDGCFGDDWEDFVDDCEVVGWYPWSGEVILGCDLD